jgi:hypothetical protein
MMRSIHCRFQLVSEISGDNLSYHPWRGLNMFQGHMIGMNIQSSELLLLSHFTVDFLETNVCRVEIDQALGQLVSRHYLAKSSSLLPHPPLRIFL